MLLGVFTTACLPETKRMTLEEIVEKYHDEVDVTKIARDRFTEQHHESVSDNSNEKMV